MCADKAGVNVGQSLFTDIDYADDAENDVHCRPSLEPPMKLILAVLYDSRTMSLTRCYKTTVFYIYK